MTNTEDNNAFYPVLAAHTVVWHKDRNLIEGSNDLTQTHKMLEELLELYAACMPDASSDAIRKIVVNEIDSLYTLGKIKTVDSRCAKEAKLDALGDIDVVRLNILERNKWTSELALQCALAEITDRKGMLIHGNFVKASSLHLYKDEIIKLGYDYPQVLRQNGVLDDNTTETTKEV